MNEKVSSDSSASSVESDKVDKVSLDVSQKEEIVLQVNTPEPQPPPPPDDEEEEEKDSEEEQPPPPPDWISYKTPEGKTYYYDKTSKVTTWTRPAELGPEIQDDSKFKKCYYVKLDFLASSGCLLLALLFSAGLIACSIGIGYQTGSVVGAVCFGALVNIIFSPALTALYSSMVSFFTTVFPKKTAVLYAWMLTMATAVPSCVLGWSYAEAGYYMRLNVITNVSVNSISQYPTAAGFIFTDGNFLLNYGGVKQGSDNQFYYAVPLVSNQSTWNISQPILSWVVNSSPTMTNITNLFVQPFDHFGAPITSTSPNYNNYQGAIANAISNYNLNSNSSTTGIVVDMNVQSPLSYYEYWQTVGYICWGAFWGAFIISTLLSPFRSFTNWVDPTF